ncbi:PAS/PAC sensor-containing diguanylate cyclase/phosphodiesterase [Simiduia agarivorans SA1 = DSM 21679]|uniref:PAS/PAC sensor-containing diguanylate cyclase/phosphodiesterase n=1 Tax=Simiduia agarivorans (strain DSM 21679 / JCM 13881 / BCRC 17597 / SA1) TaxID=1117647 RepID=K4KM43_SIMAS|nr:PAS/PAC sensor-containing diguanylate cyclase/phosphodiesterase [Simiduia agarivorans SA1 = DSM 21679]
MSDVFAAAFDASPLPQALMTPDGRYLQVSRSLLLWHNDAPLVDTLSSLWNEKLQGPSMVKMVRDAMARKGSWSGELQYQTHKGPIPVQVHLQVVVKDKDNYWLASLQDLSLRKQADLRLQKMAYVDPLTQLASAGLLADRCSQAIARAKRAQQLLMLILIQPLDQAGLRATLGTDAADSAIQSLALALVKQIRHEDTLAHLGQGRFALLVPDLKDKNQAVSAFGLITEKLRAAAGQVQAGPSNGMELQQGGALWPEDANTVQRLQQQAEQALLSASNHPQLFTPALQKQLEKRRTEASAIEQALDCDEFVLHYQPLLNTESGETDSLEALIRWQHPDRGLLLPGAFLEQAEATGNMQALGNWVLREAARQFLHWQQQHPHLQCIHVNLSAQQFRAHYLLALIRDVLADTGLPAEQLCLEITEKALQWPQAADRIDELHLMGVRLALDDYGAGPSAIQQVAAMPLYQIKLDRQFIQPIPHARTEKQLSGLAALVQGMDKQLVVCGVENARQLELAQQLGSQLVQGFLLAEPQSAEAISALFDPT